MMPQMKEILVRCEDETCKHYEAGYCNAKNIEMETERNARNQIIVVCMTYEDRREEEDDDYIQCKDHYGKTVWRPRASED